MPWDLLELDPETATERDVKRAYAKKLKVTRPDKDPKGFQELKEARDEALLQLEYGGFLSRKVDLDEVPLEESGENSQEDDWQDEYADFLQPSVASVPGDELASQSAVTSTGRPSELLDSFLGVEAALESGEKLPEATRDFESALYQHAHLATEWGEMVAELLESEEGCRHLKIKPEALLFELEHDSSAATVAVIARAEREGKRSGIGSLAGLLLENRSRIATGAGGEAMARLASACAIWEPFHLKTLANNAYELLPTAWRDAALHQVDVDTHIGQLLRGLPSDWRSFWLERFRGRHEEYDWESEEGRAALDVIRRKVPRTWDGFEAVASIVPEELARTIPKHEAPQPVHHQEQTNYQQEYRHSSAGGGSKVSGWLIFVVIFILLKLVALIAKCGEDGYAEGNDLPSPYAESRSTLGSLRFLVDEHNLEHPEDPVSLTDDQLLEMWWEAGKTSNKVDEYLKKRQRKPLGGVSPFPTPDNPTPQPAIPGFPSTNPPVPSPFPKPPSPSPSPRIPGVP